jgi:outer membrane biosynthesis protein TonB
MNRPRTSETSIAARAAESANGDMPALGALVKVMRFKEHGAALVVGASLAISALVHASVAETAQVTSITLTPQIPACKVGELIQIQAFAKTRGNLHPKVTASVTWTTSASEFARVEGNGWIRCTAQGHTTIGASFDGVRAEVPLDVEPLIQMIEVKDEPPMPPPEPEKEPEVKPEVVKPTEKPAAQDFAKAGNLLTAPADKPSQASDDAPVFNVDENGNEYGSGLVKTGGTSDHAGPKAVASGIAGGTGGKGTEPGPKKIVEEKKPDLSRLAKVETAGLCKGYYPSEADDDLGHVTISFVVATDGTVKNVNVLAEDPKGQGFGKMARACFSGRRLATPALGMDGAPVETTLTQRFTFTR